jgi:hypothetical protein
MFNDI